MASLESVFENKYKIKEYYYNGEDDILTVVFIDNSIKYLFGEDCDYFRTIFSMVDFTSFRFLKF